MLEFRRLETERTAPVLECHASAVIEQVETARHSAVTSADGVVDGVDQHGHSQSSRLEHIWATLTRSSLLWGWGIATPSRLLLSSCQPPVGWASRT